ncbi:MAG: hypothetical protein M3Z01_02895 [Thermoproteota archaeon]|nr:hypothetical protein [Thermoproteota archaeon]
MQKVFFLTIVEKYGQHSVSTDGGGTGYPHQACKFLNINYLIHSPFEKSIIERTIQYINDRTKGFDDYFPCRKKSVNKTCNEMVYFIH